MRYSFLMIVGLWLIIPIYPQDKPEVFVLDLTKIEEKELGYGFVKVISYPKRSPKLEMKLICLGKENSESDSDRIFEIQIRNISTKVQLFPIEPDGSKIIQREQKAPFGFQDIRLFLQAEENELLKEQVLFQQTLYSSDIHKDSSYPLPPGGLILVRVRGKLRIPDPWKTDKREGVLKYDVYAKYFLNYEREDQMDNQTRLRSPSIPVEFEN